jgi:hypothetical protein
MPSQRIEQPDDLSGEDRELEAALSGLRPAASQVDALACAFDAGQTRAARALRFWRGASGLLAAMLAVAIVLPVPPARRASSSSVAERPSGSNAPAELAAYYAIRDDVMNRGPDALPAALGHVSNSLDVRGR